MSLIEVAVSNERSVWEYATCVVQLRPLYGCAQTTEERIRAQAEGGEGGGDIAELVLLLVFVEMVGQKCGRRGLRSRMEYLRCAD